MVPGDGVSSHALTLAGYAIISMGGVALQLMSRREGSRIPSLGDLLRRVMSSKSGRVGVVAGWAWLGLHFFAR
jgi:uncharacterized protein DUF6186